MCVNLCGAITTHKPKQIPMTHTHTHKTMLVNSDYMIDSIKTRDAIKTREHDSTQQPKTSANGYF